MSRRLYLGRLPAECREEEINKLFDGYGKVTDCRVMAGKGFGFVEFENSRDAEDAVQAFNGKTFMGANIVVEFAKEARRREPRDDDRGYAPPPRSRRPPGHRISVSGITRDTSWQDLKDFGREGGGVSYSDIDRPGYGVLEYHTREDAENAVKLLDGRELRGVVVRVTLGGGDSDLRRDDRRDDRPRDRGFSKHDSHGHDDRHPREDRRRYDRGYDRDDDRHRNGGRNDRSRSPRRDYDRRPPRSPPRRDFDEKRMDVDDRPRYDRYEDRRGEDRRGGRDEAPPPKKREEERFDDRRPVESGPGESGWSARG